MSFLNSLSPSSALNEFLDTEKHVSFNEILFCGCFEGSMVSPKIFYFYEYQVCFHKLFLYDFQNVLQVALDVLKDHRGNNETGIFSCLITGWTSFKN